MKWLNKESRDYLKNGYLLDNIEPEERIIQIAKKSEEILEIENFSTRFIENLEKGWYSLSSPIWSNFGLKRGLPISCYGSYIQDTTNSLAHTLSEIAIMTKYGGGTSAYLGAVRHRGALITNNGTSNGSVSFLPAYDAVSGVFKQGDTRRGALAVYQDIEHPDIKEFLTIKDEKSDLQRLFFGVCVGDEWMQEMIDGDKEKRVIWASVIENRIKKGLPYIFFKGNANKNAADVYVHKNLQIHASNLCTEIMLPSNKDESFVCNLASMNLLHYDEWKNTDAVQILTYFLDSVLTEFVEKTRNLPFMNRAHEFAKNHRAIGIGALGWHSYLQSKMIPYGSLKSYSLNNEIFKFLRKETYKASEELAELYGEPEVLKGYGRRNTTLLAIAPTKSSSFILGQVSESMQPYRSNYNERELAKSTFTFKNPYLVDILASYGENTDEVWNSIRNNNGSVRHLDFLTEKERNVFKTFEEISQADHINLYASRQEFIDQGQSLNLIFHPDTPIKEINRLYIEAWQSGIKSLYYQFSTNAAQEFSRELLICGSCEA